MKIQLAEHYGLCFGVRDAIAEAERLAQQGPLTILGELVHNPVVRDRLAARGVREGRLDNTASAPTPQVMITAHGASAAARAAWRQAGFGVADGTCPLVRHAHDPLPFPASLSYFPVVMASAAVEVHLIGDFPTPTSSKARPISPATCERYGVISQTTQPIDRVHALLAAPVARPRERSALQRHRLPAHEEPPERSAS